MTNYPLLYPPPLQCKERGRKGQRGGATTVAVTLTEDSAEQVEPRATSVTTRDLIFIFKFLRNFTFQARRHQEESHFRHSGLNGRSDIQAVPKYSGLSVGHP